MTTEQIIEIANQAGITFITKSGVASATEEWLCNFAQLVRNAALEEAALKCDQLSDASNQIYAGVASTVCAQQIRSLKS